MGELAGLYQGNEEGRRDQATEVVFIHGCILTPYHRLASTSQDNWT